MSEADWYFDVVSPFAYLQWRTRERFAGRFHLRPIPVVLGAILRHWGQKGPAEIAPKRFHTYRACQWRARQLGVPFRFPPVHPFYPIDALRLLVAVGASEPAVDAVFDAAFGKGQDISDGTVLAQIGGALGVGDVAATIARSDIKDRLRANTEAAIALGVFGVPMLAVGNELFWGEDMTDLALAWSEDRSLLDADEMRRLRDLPSGQGRKSHDPDRAI
jgi:2-hydroxychromene-2-carboxylate isomerase